MEIEEIKKQHFESYKKAIIENIRRNTSTLYDEDIMSILKKPPLEAMDLIKSKFLDVAKREKQILNTEKLDGIIDDYRKAVTKSLNEMRKIREGVLIKKVENFEYKKTVNVFKLSKKDFVEINKNNKSILKQTIKKALSEQILDNAGVIFKEKNPVIETEIIEEVGKFLKGPYQRQVLENFEFKVIVKDTTLINGVKEQADHYLFTLSNSRLLKEDLEK